MRLRYWIYAETEVLVSRNGGPFEPYTTREHLIFEKPAQEVAQAMIFIDGERRICVDTAHVFRYEWDGSQGLCQACG